MTTTNVIVLPVENEQYFGIKNVLTVNPGFWFMLKLRLFGKRIEEHHGRYTCVWYAHNGVLYQTRYDALDAL